MREIQHLRQVRCIVCLGAFAWDGLLRALEEIMPVKRPWPKFGHGAEALVGGVVGLTNGREMVMAGEPIDNVLAHLGYPLYFARILGVAEVLAGVAILAPGFPRLKEWAYAGLFFSMAGAAISRAVRGDGAGHIIAPLILAALIIVSWALRPSNRTLAVLAPQKKGPWGEGLARPNNTA